MTENSNPPPAKPKAKKAAKKAAKKNRGGARANAGRNEWSPTPQQRILVQQMKFCGDSDEVIARALQVDADTLRKHCRDELSNGYAMMRAEVVALMFKEANGGNVSAIKKLAEMGKITGAQQAVEARTPKPRALGKKEEQQAAAERVGGQPGSKFAPPAAPKLVVNNP